MGLYLGERLVSLNSGIDTSSSISLQEKTTNPTEETQNITADSGYDGLSKVVVNAIPSDYIGSDIDIRTQTDITVSGATVSIPNGYYESSASKTISSGTVTLNNPTINSSGLITSSASVNAGYINAAPSNKTLQLTTQTAKTVTPTKSSQTAVSSGVYTTGTITVAAIPSNYIDTSDATATASEIISNKTAYVKGSKLTGSLVINKYYTGSSTPSSSLGSNGDLYLQV